MLPNADAAVVDPRKVSDYLLNPDHPDGAPKARFFMAFGFSRDDPSALIGALIDHARQYPATLVKTTAYGASYSVEGALASPDRRNPLVRAIWMVRDGETSPRLVTAIPMEGKRT